MPQAGDEAPQAGDKAMHGTHVHMHGPSPGYNIKRLKARLSVLSLLCVARQEELLQLLVCEVDA